MISVLFAARDSIYKTIPGLDIWDEERNALNWPGGNPGIFHPPCRLFCALKHFSTAPLKEKELAFWSVEQVRKHGGVLEHPARSQLWRDMDLPEPGSLFSDHFGVTVEIDQFRFGHSVRKLTWLYICGSDNLPPVPGPGKGINRKMKWDNRNGQDLPHMPQSQRSATTLDFAIWLIQVARGCNRVERDPILYSTLYPDTKAAIAAVYPG